MIAAGSAHIGPTTGFSSFSSLSSSFFLFLKVFFFFSFFLPLHIILKLSLSLYFSYYLLYFSSLCFLCYCSLFPPFLYYSSYITPPILHLTPYQVNLLNHPPPPHPC